MSGKASAKGRSGLPAADATRRGRVAWETTLPIALFALGALDRIWITEDAFITFRVVENVFAGNGPVYNPGIRVEAYTHPLWLLILCVLRVFGQAHFGALAALVGILFSGAGMALALAGSAALWRGDDQRGRMWPMGAAMVAAVPVFWDFASSGLEGGLAFLWLGGCLFWMTRALSRGAVIWCAFWLGLGVLVRPDLAVVWLVLVAALVWSTQAYRRPWPLVRLVAASLALPSAYQLFRMAYFAAVVPNTALAKEGLRSNWHQGFVYLWDTIGTYRLWLPLALLVWAVAAALRRVGSASRAGLAVGVAFTVAGVLHLAAITRLGGDFMHGRMLLPGLFALLAPWFLVPAPASRGQRVAIGGVAVLWVAASGLFWKPSYGSLIDEHGIADERAWYVHRSHVQRPLDLRDYRYHQYYRVGDKVGSIVAEKKLQAVYWAHIGIAPAVMPPSVVVIDPLGLNDHIGSRIELRRRGRPGHEKIAPPAWFQARYPPAKGMIIRQQLDGALNTPPTPAELDAARRVLRSPQIARLQEAVTAPLTPRLMLSNITHAVSFTRLRIPPDPVEASRTFAPPAP